MSDEEDDFWQELASDIANGLNDEDDCSENDTTAKSIRSALPLPLPLPATLEPFLCPDTERASKPKRKKKCNDATSHYHCYCLRSQNPQHPFKTYVGFTTNPERRLKQHNGILKQGGAWKTKRSGRPWEFAVIVAGFPTHKMALQFEWAWQHPHKSLLVRAILGDDRAKQVKRKRGTPGQMCILKTLLQQCPKLYDWNALTLHFLKDDCRVLYEKTIAMPALPLSVVTTNLASLEAGCKHKSKTRKRRNQNANEIAATENDWYEELPMPSPPPKISVKLIASLNEMPFYATRNQKSSEGNHTNVGNDINHIESLPVDVREVKCNSSIGDDKEEMNFSNLYRRCSDFELFEETSSSEDNEEKIKHGRRRPCRDRGETFLHSMNGSTTILETDSDENVSLLANSIKDMDVKATYSEDKKGEILDFSESSSFSDDSNKYKAALLRKTQVGNAENALDKALPTMALNFVSVDDMSNSCDSDSICDSFFLPTVEKGKSVSSINTYRRKKTLEVNINRDFASDGDTDGFKSPLTSSSRTEKLNSVLETEDHPIPLTNATNRVLNIDKAVSIPLGMRWQEKRNISSRRRCNEGVDDDISNQRIQMDASLEDGIDSNDDYSFHKTDYSFSDGETCVWEKAIHRNYETSKIESISLSPTTGRPTKTKRLSVLDLCTP